MESPEPLLDELLDSGDKDDNTAVIDDRILDSPPPEEAMEAVQNGGPTPEKQKKEATNEKTPSKAPEKSPAKPEKNSTKRDKTPSDESDLEDGEYEVERILDVKVKERQVKFLVRWKGYNSDEDSWEPAENLETAKIVLDEYRAKNAELVRKAEEKAAASRKSGNKRGRHRGRSTRSNTPATKDKDKAKTGSGSSTRRASRRATSPKEEVEGEVGEGSDSEPETKKPKKATTGRKKAKDDSDEEAAAESHDEDDEFVPTRRAKRGAGASEKKAQSKPILRIKPIEPPLGKEPAPRNAKNAWLYDDRDDEESDDSDGGAGVKKDNEEDANDEAAKKGKENEEESGGKATGRRSKRGAPSEKEDVGKEDGIEGSKRLRREKSPDVKQQDTKTDKDNDMEIVDKQKSKSKEAKKEKKEEKKMAKRELRKKHKEESVDEAAEEPDGQLAVGSSLAEEDTNEGPSAVASSRGIKFMGVVDYDNSHRILLQNSNDAVPRCRMVSIEEAVMLDAVGLVKYLLSRAVFGQPNAVD